MKIINWLFWQFQKRCKHDGMDVAADILEGLGTHIPYAAMPFKGMFRLRPPDWLAITKSCGAVDAAPKAWRIPRATWTGRAR